MSWICCPPRLEVMIRTVLRKSTVRPWPSVRRPSSSSWSRTLNPDVFNVLLQLLDDGRRTDGQGRTVDFRNTVLIMTSNLGGQQIQDMANRDFEDVRALVQQILRDHFRPEF